MWPYHYSLLIVLNSAHCTTKVGNDCLGSSKTLHTNFLRSWFLSSTCKLNCPNDNKWSILWFFEWFLLDIDYNNINSKDHIVYLCHILCLKWWLKEEELISFFWKRIPRIYSILDNWLSRLTIVMLLDKKKYYWLVLTYQIS